MTTSAPARPRYGWKQHRSRQSIEPMVLAGRTACARCGELILPGEPWDLGHVDGDPTRYAGPEHRRCNRATNGRERFQQFAPSYEPELEPEGLGPKDPAWAVPWLRGLRRVPRDAVWPRLMTPPHERAVGSLGPEFIRAAEERTGRPLRWWQRLVAVRLLEVDADGRLCWETLILSMARQLGKSWLLRELCLWRIHQGDRFGEPQDVLHTGKDLAVCKEVQRPARVWAKARAAEYKVREVNGQEEIELLADGSRWMLRAKEAVYGYGVSLGAVDEAWKVRGSSVDEGLTPTMVEREQAQLLLVSTAHRLATSLMLGRRQVALASLATGDGDLLIEWSAPRDAELDDVDAWRLASPHWTPKRERLVAMQLDKARAGDLEDPDEPDPTEAFRAQWLNQWPQKITLPTGNTEELLPAGLWAELVEDVDDDGPLWVAVEDDYGLGAAVAAAARLPDGRLEAGGWLCPDWNSALADVRRLGAVRRVRHLQVGASMLSRVPPGTQPTARPAGAAETRVGLALLRDLAANRQLVHDAGTRDLDHAVTSAHVRETPSGQLMLTQRGPTHLVRAMVWALNAAHKPTPEPRIS